MDSDTEPVRAFVPSALLLTLAIGALTCTATEVEPELVESPIFVAEDGSFSLELPVGWMRSEHTLSHDGWDRQVIAFNAGPVLEAKDGQTIDASAPELLMAMQDYLAAQPGIEFIECRAATLDGLPGFRMHFRNPPSVEGNGGSGSAAAAEVVMYCAILGETLFAFSLEGRSPDSFARDLDVLEKMVASFRHRLPAP